MAPSHHPPAWAEGLVLLALAVAVRVGTALAWGVAAPVGSDAPVWALGAVDLWRLGQADLPPLYPMLAAAVGTVGPGIATGGRWVSLLAGALVAPVVYAGARVAGSGARPARVVGIAAVLAPDLVLESMTFQPESVVALLFAIAAGSGAMLSRGMRALLPFALTVALLSLAREHGLALVLPAMLLAWATVRRPYAGLVVLAAVQLAPLLVGQRPVLLPGAAPWAQKATVVLDDARLLAGGSLPAYLQNTVDAWPTGRDTLLEPLRCAYAALADLGVAGRLVGAAAINAARAAVLSGEVFLVLGLAAVVAWRARRQTGASVIALGVVVLPALLVWSQRRHAVVLLPVALLGLAHGLGSPLRSLRITAWIALGLAVGVPLVQVPTAGPWLRAQAREHGQLLALGEALRGPELAGRALMPSSPEAFAHGAGLVALASGLPPWPHPDNSRDSRAAPWMDRVVLIGPPDFRPPSPDWAVVAEVPTMRAWVHGAGGPVSPAAVGEFLIVDTHVRPLTPLSAARCGR